MSNSRLSAIGVLILAIVAVGVYDWRQANEIARIEASLPDPTIREHNLRLLETARAHLQSLKAAQLASRVQPQAKPVKLRAGTDHDMANQPRKSMTPEAKALYLVQYRRQRDVAYRALYQALLNSGAITPAQLDQFKEALLQSRTGDLDAHDLPDHPTNEQVMAILSNIRAAQAAANASMQQSLGEAGYALFAQYQRTLPQRSAADLVSRSLDYDAAPMTADQTEKLITTLAQFPAAKPGYNAPVLGTVIDPFAAAPSTVTPEAVQAAATFLNADQLRALQQVQVQQQTLQEIYAWAGRVNKTLQADAAAAPAQ
jgi:hypothetical protein